MLFKSVYNKHCAKRERRATLIFVYYTEGEVERGRK